MRFETTYNGGFATYSSKEMYSFLTGSYPKFTLINDEFIFNYLEKNDIYLNITNDFSKRFKIFKKNELRDGFNRFYVSDLKVLTFNGFKTINTFSDSQEDKFFTVFLRKYYSNQVFFKA